MSDFPRYPGSGGHVVRPEGEPAPPAILNAVKLMYAGAAVSIVGLIIGLATAGGLKSAIRKARPKLTTAQVNSSATFLVVATVVIGLIGAGLWLWMAWANKRGRPWARILSSVFFAIATLNTVAGFSQPGDALSKILTVLVWLVGLGAIILLWRPESSAFYKASSGAPG
ncbi:MAG TPA: hypothetical protein VKD26_14745 [Streptosporangiaceae bacterium]|nr:hypothetical protein [Streptosporangiaceae bacterium]